MQISDAARESLLRRWPVARLATLAHGAPRLVPIVFAWHADRIWSPIDAKPKRRDDPRSLARVEDVRRDPRVCVLLDHYDADWSRLWWLRLDGEAEVVTAETAESDPRLAGAAAALRAKYPQYAEVPVFLGLPTALAVRVVDARSWCASEDALPRE
jgi:PPOX class probable F420-dependent enzyme